MSKLYDFSEFPKKGLEFEAYPLLIETEETVDALFCVVDVNGEQYTPAMLSKDRSQVGVRRCSIETDPEPQEYTRHIKCPFCGFEEADSVEFDDDGTCECGRCGGEFSWEREITVEYNTTPIKPPRFIKAHRKEGH